MLHRTWPNASASCRRKRNRDPGDCHYLNERDDQLQETIGAPIWVGNGDRDRWIGAANVPTQSANEYAIA